jgi:hypothetical protein
MNMATLLLMVAWAGDAAHDPVGEFLAAHCAACHAGEQAKGDLRFDQGLPAFGDDAGARRWQAILDRLNAGEMPPAGSPAPPSDEARTFSASVRASLAAAAAGRGRVVLRRLNRVEYENTVRDLLGIEIDLRDRLPVDTAAEGFDNVGEALHVSPFLMERYLETADAALNTAIVNTPCPPLHHQRYSLKNQHSVKSSTERVYLQRDDAVTLFSSSLWNAVILYEFYPPDRGHYHFRLCVRAVQSGDKPVTFRVEAGPMLMATVNHLVGYFDAPPNEPRIVEFVDRLEARSTISILPYGLATAHVVNPIGAENYQGPGLQVDWVEVEGPIYDAWPPESHRRIFGDLPQAAAPGRSDRLEVTSEQPAVDAARILRDFVGRAFRMPVTDDDVRPFLSLVESRLADGYSFEQAIRVGLMGVLVSPKFLYLREPPGKLDDFALASRLSYFLWSSMPDEELLALAAAGELSREETLRRQVERLLDHPRAAAFTENFVGQWLGLRDIDFTEPSYIYPEYDHLLRASMVRETELFFAEVLRSNLSLTNFVSSDFSMLNGRLARHYGIPGIDGWEFRKVELPAGSHRGGMLTMASVLKTTANGTTTSPVKRGAWVLDRILGTPPAPPPADVPALEPDIRGATTIREQLAKHREVAACASCHAKIDPPGFALESFDVIGGWRDHYRTSGNGDEVYVDGQRMPYQRGASVDPGDVLADGRAFRNIDEFKQLLLADRDQLARALTRKLLVYATGAASKPADGLAIENIVARIREQDYGFRGLIHEIVQSEPFQTK